MAIKQTPEPSHAADGAIDRVRDALAQDVAEAREIAPLVDAAAEVPRGIRALLRRALPLLVLLAAGAALIASGLYRELALDRLADHQQWLQARATAYPWLTAGGLALTAAAVIGTGLPGALAVVVLAGVLFGTWVGGLVGMFGGVLGSSVLFAASRRMFSGGRAPPALLARVRDGYQRNPASYTFFMRLLPVFPLGPFSVALAWLGCRWPLFLLSTAIGAWFTGTVNAAVGAGLAHVIATRQQVDLGLLSEPRLMVPLFLFAALALVPAALGLRGRRSGGSKPPADGA
jgi:uncharacterized membrane protein YdjX (TVP38/TMEM64 family)